MFTIHYENGEYGKELSIWRNGAGTRCGSFKIATSKNHLYHPKMTEWGIKTEYKMDFGSGIILGAWGQCGHDVDSLGILMLRRISGTDLIEVKYDLKSDSLQPPRLISVQDIRLENPSGTDSDKGFFKVSKSRATGGEWSITLGCSFGQKFEVTAGVPEVASASSQSSWEISVSSTNKSTWSSTDDVDVYVAFIVPKFTRVCITVEYYEGILNKLPFDGKMKYYLDNHAAFNTFVKGYYNGVSTTRFIQTTQVLAYWNSTESKWQPDPTDDSANTTKHS